MAEDVLQDVLLESGLSFVEYEGDGSQVAFILDFTLGYLNESEINAEIDDVPVPGTEYTIEGDTITFDDAPAEGSIVRLRRIIDKTELTHSYVDGSILNNQTLDESFLQTLMVAHEFIDGFVGGLDIVAPINMNDNVIFNLAEGELPHNAATFGQVQVVQDDLDDFKTQIQDLVDRAEAAAIAAEAARDDVDLTYAGARTDFPTSWPRVGAFMYYLGDEGDVDAPTGIYIYDPDYSNILTGNWRPQIQPVDGGIFHQRTVPTSPTSQIPLDYVSAQVDVFIHGVKQAQGPDYTLGELNDRIIFPEPIDADTVVDITLFVDFTVAARVTAQGGLPADDIYNLDPVDIEIGDAYVVTEDGTIVGENDDWLVGHVILYTINAEWANVGAIQGPEGPQGPQGEPGQDGVDGVDGEDGAGITAIARLDAADIAAVVGQEPGDLYICNDDDPTDALPGLNAQPLDGIVWLESGAWDNIGPIQGEDGIQGPAGNDGQDGADGAQGPAGPQGPMAEYQYILHSGDNDEQDFPMAPGSVVDSQCLVAISGVMQDTNSFEVIGNTVRFVEAPPTGIENISIVSFLDPDA